MFGSHTFVLISWMCKKQTADSTVPSLKLFRLTLVYVWMVLPALPLWECVLKPLSSESAEETLSVTSARVNPSHSDNGVFEFTDHFRPSIPDSSAIKRSIGGYVSTIGMFTTMQLNSLLSLWQIRRPKESRDARRFSRKTLLLLSFRRAPSDVSGDDTTRAR